MIDVHHRFDIDHGAVAQLSTYNDLMVRLFIGHRRVHKAHTS